MTLKVWLKGLGVFVASSVITSLAATRLDPQNFNFSRQGISKLGALVVIIAAKALFLYFKSSPLQVDSQGKIVFTARDLSNLAMACAVLPAVLLLVGCVSSWERTTYATLASSKSVIDCAVAGYNNVDADIRRYCAADPADPAFDPAGFRVPQTRAAQLAIEKARQTQVAAVEAFEAYAVAKVGRDKNVSLADKQAAVAGVLAQLPALIDALRGLFGSAAAGGTPVARASLENSYFATEMRRHEDDLRKDKSLREPQIFFDPELFPVEKVLAGLRPISAQLEVAHGGN
jgi:hypothetical protein